MQPSLVAVVDLFEPYRTAFRVWAEAEGFVCAPLESGAALAAATTESPALCVMGIEGTEQASPSRVRLLRKTLNGCPLVLVVRNVTIDAVVALVRSGVADVIGAGATADVIARATLHLTKALPDRDLVGQSVASAKLRKEIAAVAPLRSTVLLTGETGVGKGLVARLIHRLSSRADGPFVHVDCSALAPSLVESELFGHERGAFTGALARRIGRVELAGDGTLFLDEVGDLVPEVQAKLLRLLQDRAYERVGGAKTQVATARIVAATNRDLRREVAEGRFRPDLFFRLNVFHIHIPPLRERLSDVPLLARSGLERIAERLELAVPVLSDSFYARLQDHAWPGNVRELLNVLERILVQHQAGLLDETSLASGLEVESEGLELASSSWQDGGLDQRSRIEAALLSSGGNISRAARRLGLARGTLRYRIRQHGLAHLIPRD
jgi:DNA-binding NtrC family response regulator